MWALIGSYASEGSKGGITVFRVDPLNGQIDKVGHGNRDIQAGYMVHSAETNTIYCVDERKTDGRGPVGPAASVHAFAFDAKTGALSWKNSQLAPAPFPTFLDLSTEKNLLVCANHGSFEHVEHVVKGADGDWRVEYLYDHSTVIVYRLDADGRIGGISDVVTLKGHGTDPNASPQAGGHAQSSAHAHCAVIDPTGQFVIVCDKGTDTMLVYRLGEKLALVSTYRFPPETAPRHIAFTAKGTHLFVTLELSSELASMGFDPVSGQLTLIDRTITTDGHCERGNEPAELRLHPNERFVYVNNRGEDTLAWFGVDPAGYLQRKGHTRVADSIHPGLAARSFVFDPTGQTILFADRPADMVRVLAVDAETGALTEIAQAPISQPAFIALIPETT